MFINELCDILSGGWVVFLFEDNEGEAFVMQIQVRDNDEWKRLLESIEKRTNVFTPKFRLEEVGEGVFNIYTKERWKKWVREFILFVLEVEGIRHKASEDTNGGYVEVVVGEY